MNRIINTDNERLARAEAGGRGGNARKTEPDDAPDAQSVADFERALCGGVCPLPGAGAGHGAENCGVASAAQPSPPSPAPSGLAGSPGGKARSEDEKYRENAVGAMLAQHGAGHAAASGTAHAAASAPPHGGQAASAAFTENMERLVRRILVAAPENGKSEIVISLDESLLPGTEIHMIADADGMLHVRLDVSNPAVLRILDEARDDLRKRLEKYGRGVKVSVGGPDYSGKSGAN